MRRVELLCTVIIGIASLTLILIPMFYSIYQKQYYILVLTFVAFIGISYSLGKHYVKYLKK